MKRKTKIMVVDDHPIVRYGLKKFLERREGLEVVGEAEDGEVAMEKARRLLPDIILLDIEMPHVDGFTVTRALERELPQVRVIVVSNHVGTGPVTKAIQAGGRAYVLKDRSMTDLPVAIERVSNGQVFFPPESAGLTRSQTSTRS
jgi:two-component system, NarL family, response regulator NreC